MSKSSIPGKAAFMAKVKAAAALKNGARAEKEAVKKNFLPFKVGAELISKADGRVHLVKKVSQPKVYYSENADGTGAVHAKSHLQIREAFDFKIEVQEPTAAVKNLVPEKLPFEKKPLFLIMEKIWFDKIYSGRKKIEYRDDSPFYRSRFLNKNGQFRNYKNAVLQIGYHKDARRMTVEIKDIYLGDCFEIHLGKITDQNF